MNTDTRDPNVAQGPTPSEGTTPEAAPSPELKVTDRRWWVRPDDESGGEEWRPRKPSYVEELERQVADKDRQLSDHIGKYREASSEFETARVRMRRDVGKEVERRTRTVLAELLDVVDNLDRAIEAARQAAERGALLQGVEMVRDQFLAKLEGFGVKRIAPLAQPFDPARHEAASVVPSTDPRQDNVIVGVIREGYEINGELLRPAVVAVARLVLSPESGSA
jgi:molecular chaperone GrpE